METKVKYYVGAVHGGYAVFMIDTEGHTSQVGKTHRAHARAAEECSKWRERERAAAAEGHTT